MFKVENVKGMLKRKFFSTQQYQKLIFTPQAYLKMMAYMHLIGDLEITGLGKLSLKNKEKQIYQVDDIAILEQEVRSAYVDTSATAISDFIQQLPTTDAPEQWALDWHSHVNMATSPSGTDWDNYEEMSKLRMNNTFPFIVANKKGDIFAGEYISDHEYYKLEVQIPTQDELRTAIDQQTYTNIYNQCKNDIELKCTKYVAPITHNTTAAKRNWNDDSYWQSSKNISSTNYKQTTVADDEGEIMMPYSTEQIEAFKKLPMKAQEKYLDACDDTYVDVYGWTQRDYVEAQLQGMDILPQELEDEEGISPYPQMSK